MLQAILALQFVEMALSEAHNNATTIISIIMTDVHQHVKLKVVIRRVCVMDTCCH